MPKIYFEKNIYIGRRQFLKGETIHTDTLTQYVVDMLIRYGKIRVIADKNPNTLEGWS